MKLKIDRENHALYFRLYDSDIVKSKEVQPGVIPDFDSRGQTVGVEILHLSTRVDPERLKVLQFETA
jgi:uncharacterized protein YuzE